MNSSEKLLDMLAQGKKEFKDLDFDDIKLENVDLSGCSFEHCTISGLLQNCTVTNTTFMSSNIKSTWFEHCELTGTTIKECLVDGVKFINSNLEKLAFKNNYFQSWTVSEKDLPLFTENRVVQS